MRTIGGRYELRGELASGGMATVHLARQLGAAGFARIVAVKRLHGQFARDPDFVAMFLDEARLVGRIRHPNVVQTLDVVEETPELFIVMEYIHGESLVRLLNATWKAGESIPLKIASAIMVGVLHGLHEAHEAKSETGEPLGIVHRDVSPHNVLVGIDGVARVLDFGVAKAEERMSATSAGKVKGKIAYMAPEQVEGAPDICRRTDVYAAAIVFWEMLTGQRLFQGVNDAATVRLAMEAKVAAPGTLNPNVPAALDAVLMKGLARNRAERYATAAEFAHAIAAVVPTATPSELGAWVRKTAQEDLDLKTKLIAAIEMRGVAKRKNEAAKSLEALGEASGSTSTSTNKTQIAPDAPTSPTRTALVRPAVQKTLLLPSSAGSAPAAATKSTQLLPRGPTDPDPGTRVAVMTSSPSPAATTGPKPLVIGLAVGAAILVVGGAILSIIAWKTTSATATVPTASSRAEPSPRPAATCSEGMVLAPAGQFFMGSDDHSSTERPAHKVALRAFCIDRYEVTTAKYKDCSDRGSCLRLGADTTLDELPAKQKKTADSLCNRPNPARSEHPANCLGWELAKEFCAWRGARLPTEAEWEYAARGPEQRMYAWGDQAPTAKLLNGCGLECVKWKREHDEPGSSSGAAPPLLPLYESDDGWPTTAPVGSFPEGASRVGAEDMQGNVWEWVADYYALYGTEAATDPTGPEAGRDRVIRGGAWNSGGAEWLRATYRSPQLPSTRSHIIGFRCAKSL